MKSRLSSVISVVLTLVMVMVLFSGAVSAKEYGDQTHDGITFKAWTERNCLPGAADLNDGEGSFYLTKDVTLDSGWEVPAGTVNLCLNGHVINFVYNKEAEKEISSVIFIGVGAVLNLYDCEELPAVDRTHQGYTDEDGMWHWDKNRTHELLENEAERAITGGIITGGIGTKWPSFQRYGGGVVVKGGTFNMFGGTIAGNTADIGAGVEVINDEGNDKSNAVFTLQKGSVICNLAHYYAGGGVDNTDGLFEMVGGNISDNTACDCGGGVFVDDGGVMEMSGGSVSGNVAYYENGGGIFIDNGGSFDMSEGSVCQNSAQKSGGGIFIYNGGSFDMSGGSVSQNSAQENGGGVYIRLGGSFDMSGGTIIENTADFGGGVYDSYGAGCTFAMTGGAVTCNTAATNGAGVYVKAEAECLAAGTPITLGDGSRVAVENLKKGDVVRAFDHETGTITRAKLFDLWKYPTKQRGAFTLHFKDTEYINKDDIDVTVVGGHCFFDRAANEYIALTARNVDNYIGHEFYNADENSWAVLTGVDFLNQAVDTYIIVTEKYYNCVANGMLSNEDGIYMVLSNVFDYGEPLKIDLDKKAADLKTYGIWGFENVQYASKQVYDALNLQNLNVAFGKGMLTTEDFAFLEAYTAEIDPELISGSSQLKSGVQALGASPLFEDPEPEPEPETGFCLGGTAEIMGNCILDSTKQENVYLESNTYIAIGEGSGEGKNGISRPASGMKIGVTSADTPDGIPVQITTNGNREQTKYFQSDNNAYAVSYNAEGKYLELALVYEVNVAEGITNGSITPDKASAAAGDTVTLTLKPSAGYEYKVGSLKVNEGKVEVSKVNDTVYTFIMPSQDVTVKAEFEQIPPEPVPDPDPENVCPRDDSCVIAKFKDADPKKWYHDGLHFCIENKIMVGVSAEKIAPDAPLTRAQLTMMLWKMAGSPVVDYEISFKDVKNGKWYTEAIRWAQSIGIIAGYSKDTFAPDQKISREQLAAILMRYAAYQKADVSKRADLTKYTDAAEISSYAKDSVAWAVAMGIIAGKTQNTIAPLYNATRAEAACMLQRFAR